MKRCLVTGADGFIGRVLCQRLEAAGERVYCLSRTAAGPDAIAADLGRDPVTGLIEIGPDVVFHLAARVHGDDAESEHNRVTVAGTRDLLRAAAEAGAGAFVFFSTCAVMPEGSASVLDETTPPRPYTSYGRAKLAAEQLVLDMNDKSGMRTACIRLPMVYGPGQKGHLARMIRAIERGVFPPLPDYPGKRSLVQVEDAARAAMLIAERSDAAGKVYIVAEPRPYSSREIYELVLEFLGRRPPGWRLPDAVLSSAAKVADLGEWVTRRRLPFNSAALSRLSRPAVYSAAKIERELGFRAERNFANAARELVAWNGR